MRVFEKEKWIKGAIKHPGALRRIDPTPDTPLSATDLKNIEKSHPNNTTIKRRVNLARTLKKLPRHHGPRECQVPPLGADEQVELNG